MLQLILQLREVLDDAFSLLSLLAVGNLAHCAVQIVNSTGLG